jgi:methylmalonyl-CoA mutase
MSDANEALAAEFKRASVEDWSAQLRARRGDAPLETELDGLSVNWLYTAEDELAPDPGGVPGSDPYVRGTRVGTPWAIRQEIGAPTRSEANSQVLEDLEGGAAEVLLRLRSDGAPGVPVDSVSHLEEVLDAVHLDLAPVALVSGSGTAAVAGMVCQLWRAHGVDPAATRGSLGIDPIATLARGRALAEDEFTPPIQAALRQLAQVQAEFPQVQTLAVDTVPYVDDGADATLELATAIATAIAYLRAGEAASIAPEDVARGLEFRVVTGPDQFLEIAKLRALRRLWASVLEACGVGPEGRRSPTYTQTSRRMVSSLDPWVNMLRATTAAFAAAVAGADGITVVPFDEPRGTGVSDPGQLGRRNARNTQLVLLEEASLHRVADPAGGSWYVESLTDQVAQAAWCQLQAIERAGGIVAALASGRIPDAVATSAVSRHDALSRRRREMTGVNTFPLLGRDGLERGPVDATRGWQGSRDGSEFEALRARAAGLADPRLVLVNVGPLSSHVSVNLWARSFFESGGVVTVSQPEARIELGELTVASVCAGRDDDPAPAIAALRQAGAVRIYLTGAGSQVAIAAGADVGVHDGVDMVAVLSDLLDLYEGGTR